MSRQRAIASTVLIVVVILAVVLGAQAQPAERAEVLTADEQIMISVLSVLYGFQKEACAELKPSQLFQAEAQRVLQRLRQNHPDHAVEYVELTGNKLSAKLSQKTDK